ncbi:hypothetical protein KJ780_04305 [Candidatus Micrarchaeota archaeon]|nr:hypothetical protein [Candidatus Micrarchaeota archaeon]
MSYKVSFILPERELGRADIEFKVIEGREKLGRLRVSKGSVVWLARDKTYGRKLNWREFAEMMEQAGRKE